MKQRFIRLLAIATIATLCLAQTAAPQYATPDEAKDALSAAASKGLEAVRAVLGAGAQDVIHTGDPVQDKNLLDRFNQRVREKMSIMPDAMNPDRALILAGDDEWPFPIPLKLAKGKWTFDLAEGKTEIFHRIIGGNELDAIEICRGYVEAQQIYAEEDRTGSGYREYARKVISSKGKKDGLYWPGDDSPIAGAIANAAQEGYASTGGKPAPYHGYHFKILTAQGPAARGGANDYIVKGMMIGGFALIAWPSEYGVSGIMTFIVNQDGVVFQKDLGPSTGSAAKTITRFNPDSSWQEVPES